jgi:hypothetical protein
VTDHGHDRGGENQPDDRMAQAGVRAQGVGGGEQHEHERQAPHRVVSDQAQQRNARPDRQPHQQRLAAAHHQRPAQQQGQHRQQPPRSDDRLTADQARRTPRGDGDQPGSGDPQPSIGQDSLVITRQSPNGLHTTEGIPWPGHVHHP